jgi:hypothetical protein
MRDTFKSQNPNMTVGQLSKYTSAMYAELTPQEKEAWQARAEADKSRYLMEMAAYVPPVGYDARGDAIAYPKHAMVGNKRGKYRKDPNAPKRNLSAYLLYQNAMRDQFKSDNPGMTFGQLSKYTSHMFKSLTPEEKGQWDVRAQDDKARYDIEMSSYVPPPGHDATGKLIDDTPPVKRPKKPRDPNAPKRARGSYVFYTFEARPIIMAENPDVKFVELGSIMGQRWRALTPEQKRKFEELANEDKIRFNRERQEYNLRKSQEAAELAASEASAAAEMAQMPIHVDSRVHMYQAPVTYQAPVHAPVEYLNANEHHADYQTIGTTTYLDPNQAYYDPSQYHYSA